MSGEDVYCPVQETSTSERETLLPSSSPDPSFPSKVAVASLVIPVAIAARLAVALPTTTTIDVVHQIVCRMWYAARDPQRVPPIGRIPDPTCAVPPVEQYFSAVITIITILETIGAMIGYSAVSYFASRHGRKPVILSMLALYAASLVSFIVAGSSQGWVVVPFLVLWTILHSISDSPPFILATNMYVIDLVEPQNRMAALSTIAGWTNLGAAPAYAVGGLIANHQSVSLVYYIAVAIFIATMIYVALVLPESFPQEKRQELRHQRAMERRALRRNSSLYEKMSAPFEPLKQLKPRRKQHTGTRNWRPVYCAIHVFIAHIGDEYATIGVVLFLTTRHGYTPVDTGYVLTAYLVLSVLVLTVLIPLLVQYLRPFYMPNRTSTTGSGLPSRPAVYNEAQSEVLTEPSDRMGVHITFGSWVVVTLAMIFVGLAVSKTAVLAAVMFWSLGAGRRPVFRSLVVSSVDPLKQGDALSAIEMMTGLGAVLSPIVMGSIFTATISTFPQLMFYIHGVIVMAAASILFLIRDSDRYDIWSQTPVDV